MPEPRSQSTTQLTRGVSGVCLPPLLNVEPFQCAAQPAVIDLPPSPPLPLPISSPALSPSPSKPNPPCSCLNLEIQFNLEILQVPCGTHRPTELGASRLARRAPGGVRTAL